jgi:uncharacterized protein (TIGR02145 family)
MLSGLALMDATQSTLGQYVGFEWDRDGCQDDICKWRRPKNTGANTADLFRTLAIAITTAEVTEITTTTATGGGDASDDGGDPFTARGVCWSTSENATTADSCTSDGSGMGSFTSALTGLTPDTTYYVRAYATNSAEASYGENLSFATAVVDVVEDQVADLDGNIYNTVQIGSQEWTVENLRTTRYANGDSIPNVTDGPEWNGLMTGAWAHYDNELQHDAFFGKLYNWYAAEDDRDLCPSGWHMPNENEWTELTDFLGGVDVAGGPMKAIGTLEAGTGLWLDPNTDATNSSGFAGLPGGARYGGNFFDINRHAMWWATTPTRFRRVEHDNGGVVKNHAAASSGLSVRCVRD